MSTRRDFLSSSLSLLALSVFPHVFVKNALAKEKDMQIYKQTFFAMGTIVSFTAIAPSSAQAHDAFMTAMQEIERLEQIFSRHNSSSALSVLNSEGALSSAPKELVFVLEQSREIARNTQEIYNPAVKPLLDLFEGYQDIQSSPKKITEAEIKEVQEYIKLSEIQIEKNAIRFGRENMGITLDSIAKGYIVDKASELLLARGIENHIINAGGDIIAKGRKSQNEQWLVGIEDPERPGQALRSFPLENQALATSGSYQKFFDKNKERHHIIDPKTAQSPSFSSVSCKAFSAMNADVYATVLSLLPTSPYSKYRA